MLRDVATLLCFSQFVSHSGLFWSSLTVTMVFVVWWTWWGSSIGSSSSFWLFEYRSLVPQSGLNCSQRWFWTTSPASSFQCRAQVHITVLSWENISDWHFWAVLIKVKFFLFYEFWLLSLLWSFGAEDWTQGLLHIHCTTVVLFSFLSLVVGGFTMPIAAPSLDIVIL